MEGNPQEVVRFGVFEVDLQTMELHKSGMKVPLQGQPFQVFAILLERSGELVTREELRGRVWPKDTFVDFDHALNTAITKIRIALGDDADNPRFVETLPRRGYRFIGLVDKPTLEAPSPTVSKERIDGHAKRGPWVGIGAALAVLLLGLGVLYFTRTRSVSPAASKTIPLSSFPGDQCCPSFSPDGNQVAFVWTGPKQDNIDIYVKLVGTENTVRLTSDAADDLSPAWSPDGRYIAFLRSIGNKLGVFLVSPIGGPERQVTEVHWVGPGIHVWAGKIKAPYSDGLSWSMDSKWLAVSDTGITLVSVETGEKRQLTLPPPGQYDDTPAFSPDGQSLVFSRVFATGVSELYRIVLSGHYSPKGEPKQLTFAHYWSKDPVWTTDGREIIFSSGALSYLDEVNAELWRMPITSGDRQQPRFTGINGGTPAISHHGNLAYMRKLTDVNIWRLELSSSRHKAAEPIKLISSTQLEMSPQYSPDGRKVVFSSARSGTLEIWVASADGSNALQLTHLGATMAGSPRWSPDGQEIVFDSTVGGEYNLYSISANGGRPRRLTDNPAVDAVGTYSRDGRWIYFLSRRSGRNEIWKIPAAGGEAIRVTQNGGYVAFESPDGSMLYYAKGPFKSSIWKMPVNGGPETEVIQSIIGFAFAVAKTGLYFERVESDGRTSIQFLSFSTGNTSNIISIRPSSVKDAPLGHLSVSPDEHYLLYTQTDQEGSDLMLVENFR